MPDRDAGDHRVLPAAPDAVDVQGRPLPEALERGIARLPVRLRQPEVAQVLRFRKGDGGQLPAASRRERRDAVVEASHGDGPVAIVQAGQDRAEDMQRIRDRPAVAARVQVGVGALNPDIQRDQALGGESDRRLGWPPHRSVRRNNQVGGELASMAAEERR